MNVALMAFAMKGGGLWARVGVNDPVSVLMWVGYVLAYILIAGAVIYAVMMAVQQARYGTEEKDEDNTVLLVAMAASAAAGVVTWLMCKGPFLLSGRAGIEQAALYMVEAVAAGEVAVRVGWAALDPKPKFERRRLSWTVAAGWVFLPCVMLLARGRSVWVLLGAMVAVVPPVLLLRWSIPIRAEKREQAHAVMPTLYGTPVEKTGWGKAVVAAMCAQAAVLLAALERPTEACLPMLVAIGMMVWRWSASARRRGLVEVRSLRRWVGAAAMVAFVAMLMTQWMAPRLGMLASDTDASKSKEQKKVQYFSVVLIPPPKKRENVDPPKARKPGFTGGKREAVVIEFDGAYWYFQPPLIRPDDNAHKAMGRATEVNVHSVDDDTLIMEAHQPLIKPVPLDCCSAIDVSVLNADTRPGRIVMAVMLRDTTAPAHFNSIVLPAQVLTSSMANVAPGRPVVEEVVRFSLDGASRPPNMRQFDEITVLFTPQWGRRLVGTKVEIRSFTLVP